MKKLLPNLNDFKEFLKISDIFDYPKDHLFIKNIKFIKISNPKLNLIVNEFVEFYEKNNSNLDSLQELYTLTFDLKPIFYPYLSYYIHYDSFNRNTEMIKLRDLYNKYEFYLDKELNELPDHIFIVLKFLEFVNNDEILKELLMNLIIPSFNNYYNSVFRQLKPDFILNNPYCKLIYYLINILNIDSSLSMEAN